MVLVIDVGNSQAKWALMGSFTGAPEKFGVSALETLDPILAALLKDHIAIISSVSDLSNDFESHLFDQGRQHMFLKASTPIPVRMDYKTPETLGLDRIANAVAAHIRAPEKNTLVIDAGTCLTFDLIDSEGIYRGGSISPGLQIRVKALNNYTSALPLVALKKPVQQIGRSTEESILSGVLNGTTAEINGMIHAYQEEYPALDVVLTGGDANLFEDAVKNETFADAFFTLRGLYAIYKYNRIDQ